MDKQDEFVAISRVIPRSLLDELSMVANSPLVHGSGDMCKRSVSVAAARVCQTRVTSWQETLLVWSHGNNIRSHRSTANASVVRLLVLAYTEIRDA